MMDPFVMVALILAGVALIVSLFSGYLLVVYAIAQGVGRGLSPPNSVQVFVNSEEIVGVMQEADDDDDGEDDEDPPWGKNRFKDSDED